MLIKNFNDTDYSKRILFIIITSYVLILIVLFSSFVTFERRNAVLRIKGDVQKRAEEFLLSIDAEASKRDGEINRLFVNNSLKIPLSLGIKSQLNGLMSKLVRENNSLGKTVIVDKTNAVLYNSTSLSYTELLINTSDKPYSGWYSYNNSLLRIRYIPVFYEDMAAGRENMKVGAVIDVSSLLDFFPTAVKSLRGSSYIYYGFLDGKAVFALDEKGAWLIDKPLNPDSIDKLKDGFNDFIINGDRTLMYIKRMETLDRKPFFLSIAVPSSVYSQMEGVYIHQALLNFLLAAALITILTSLAYLLLKLYIKSVFAKRMEIQTLRMQRHDFSKHLNIIKGMVMLTEYEELDKYVHSLRRDDKR